MVKILDTTLRDGSYVIDFQFTAKDTAIISAAVDDAGIPFIEVGHGVGLNGTSRPKMHAAATDEEYLNATAQSVKSAKWGMFFIPGIGRLEDIVLAAKYGMDFIRIGTDVTHVEQSEPYIQKAKELGMYVCSNFMKTYAMTPDEVGQQAFKVAQFGSDLVCVVDSAGGMFSEDVEAYFAGIRKHTDLPIGFHGHNNLGLAMANTLKAVDLGAEIVDTSIRGMGRSAGNAVTEMLLLMLKRRGIEHGVDVTKILNAADHLIDPFLKNYQQVNSIGIISGYAQFHSSFLGLVLDHADKYLVDPRELIVRLTQVDRVNAPKELVDRLAHEMSQEKTTSVRRVNVYLPHSHEEFSTRSLTAQVQSLIKEAEVVAKKYAKTTVFNLVQSYRNNHKGFISSVIHEGTSFVVASAEVATKEEAQEVAAAVNGQFTFILLDADAKSKRSQEIVSTAQKALTQSSVLLYQDLDVWSRSVVALINELISSSYLGHKVLVVGENGLGDSCHRRFKSLGVEVTHASTQYQPNLEELYSQATVWVVCDVIEEEMFRHIKADAVVIDALIGGLRGPAISFIHKRGGGVYRADMQTMIQAEIQALVEMSQLVKKKQGMGVKNGVSIAAGGVVAPRGTVIVDSVSAPRTVFGVASGEGFLLHKQEMTEPDKEHMQEIEAFIATEVMV